MPNKSQSVLLAGASMGVAAALASFIPTVGGCVACILYIGAGAVAVWHYTDRHQLTLKGGQGLSLGALAGLATAIVLTVFNGLFVALGIQASMQEQMRQGFERSQMDPAQAERMMELFSSPLALAGTIVFGLVVASLLGGIGGVIGANVFQRERDIFDDGGEPERS